uniref:Nucleolar complex protein 2 homolog n=1 Tax=Syphacia muris TaxID=451379 RepID=A0A0N5AEN2_9BILA
MKIRKRKVVVADTGKKKKRKITAKINDPEVQEEAILDSGDDEKLENAKEHKAQLAALAEKDPEFYKFLQEQDADLLEFNESDIDDAEEESDDSNASAKDVQDADDYLTEDLKIAHDQEGRKIINQKVVDYLLESFSQKLQPGLPVVSLAIKSFMACVARVGGSVDKCEYVVNDGHVFEEIIRCCFQYLPKTLYLMLRPIDKSDSPKHKKRTSRLSNTEKLNQAFSDDGVMVDPKLQFRRWRQHRVIIKKYLNLLLLFLKELQTTDVVVAALKTVLQLVNLLVFYKELTKKFIKSVVRIWSRRSEECQCVAFMIFCKIIRFNKKYYKSIFKSCYVAYVSNTRLITSETWPLITFMQKSFAEISILRPDITYHYAFIYIRQIAIHLRNAMIAKRKDLLQTVYNWQYIMCMYLWVRVIGKARRVKKRDDDIEGIAQLSYPLIQIAITTLKLYPSLRYFPLRLHCLRILLMAQVNCKVYIQTLPLSIELLDDAAAMIKKKPTKGKGSVKATDFTCLLKMTKPQLEDAGFRQSALEALFKLQLEAAYLIRNQSFFPDMMVPLQNQISGFSKLCKNVNHARLFKSLSVTLKKHADYVANIVAELEIDLNDPGTLKNLNRALNSEDSPLSQFYGSWKNVWNSIEEQKKSIIKSGSETHNEQKPNENMSRISKATEKNNLEESGKRLKRAPRVKSENELKVETDDSGVQTMQNEGSDELRDLSLWDAD